MFFLSQMLKFTLEVLLSDSSIHTSELNITQEEDRSGRTVVSQVQLSHCVLNLKISEGILYVGATTFLSVSHLVQMYTRVNSRFGLVALKVGVDSLFTHAHSGKHLSNLLQRTK